MSREITSSEIERELRELAADPAVTAAVDHLRDGDETTLAIQIGLSEIPAPPFDESRRAVRLAELFREAGLETVHVDDVGNVIADRPGASSRPVLVVSAHLDTVFPAGTDVTVTREGSLLKGPGISDDGRGLAALVALSRALQVAGLKTAAPIRFLGTVGEEGAGDLRGVKAYFADRVFEEEEGRVGRVEDTAGFISLDGAGIERIVAKGLGSRRFRITIRGPGGHSWVDWGTANPAHALMTLGDRLHRLRLRSKPKTTLTIARLGGGKSINAIPQEAWLEIDTRSEDDARLEALVGRVRDAVDAERAVNEELEYLVAVIGDRPGGETSPDSRLAQAALAATRFLGHEPTVALSSTDANVPMNLGVPAITLGCGGEAGKAHTTEEWYRNTDGPDGIVRALYTVLLVARLAG